MMWKLGAKFSPWNGWEASRSLGVNLVKCYTFTWRCHWRRGQYGIMWQPSLCAGRVQVLKYDCWSLNCDLRRNRKTNISRFIRRVALNSPLLDIFNTCMERINFIFKSFFIYDSKKFLQDLVRSRFYHTIWIKDYCNCNYTSRIWLFNFSDISKICRFGPCKVLSIH